MHHKMCLLLVHNITADIFKKYLTRMGRPSDTGQRIPCFDSCQLITTLMCNQFSPGLPGHPKYLESVRINIDIPVVWTDGRSVYGHVNTRFSRYNYFLLCGWPQLLER